MPRSVRREIDRTLGPGRRAREVALALSVGAQAIDEDHVDIALEMLAWAKDQAPRVAAIREAYGIARYLDGDFSGALTELQAYSRMSGRTDQQHVVGDCLRGLGRELERVRTAVQPLLDDPQAPSDRRAEAAIVLAGAEADAGDVPQARRTLDEALRREPAGGDEHHLRLRSLAADLARRDGDPDTARRQLRSLLAADPDDPYEAAARLDELDGGDT